jgi:anti-sigma B factor antagonist
MLLNRPGADAFTVQREGGEVTTVLVLSGELDLAGSEQFSEALAWTVERGRGDVVLDCAELTFMDSTAIHLIGRARASLAAEDRTLTLERTQRSCRRALELCGLSDWLADDPEVIEEAVDGGRARPASGEAGTRWGQ